MVEVILEIFSITRYVNMSANEENMLFLAGFHDNENLGKYLPNVVTLSLDDRGKLRRVFVYLEGQNVLNEGFTDASHGLSLDARACRDGIGLRMANGDWCIWDIACRFLDGKSIEQVHSIRNLGSRPGGRTVEVEAGQEGFIEARQTFCERYEEIIRRTGNLEVFMIDGSVYNKNRDLFNTCRALDSGMDLSAWVKLTPVSETLAGIYKAMGLKTSLHPKIENDRPLVTGNGNCLFQCNL